jgi:hypothetical protein
VTYGNNASVGIEWRWGSTTVYISSYGPRGGDRGLAIIPTEILGDLLEETTDAPHREIMQSRKEVHHEED